MKKPSKKQILWSVVGAAAGYAWYYFVGCTTGSCAIGSNPYISTMYGGVVGFIASGGIDRKKAEPDSAKAREGENV